MTGPVTMEWRVCPRSPDWEVSECGDLRRCVAGHNRPIGYRVKGYIDQDGYLAYAIDVDGKPSHLTAYRLVAEAFIGPAPSERHEVAHNNGSRVSANRHHLRWALRKENDEDRVIHETDPKGTRNGNHKLSEADVHFIRREYRRVKRERVPGGLVALEQRFDIHRSTMISVATMKSWRHLPYENGL